MFCRWTVYYNNNYGLMFVTVTMSRGKKGSKGSIWKLSCTGLTGSSSMKMPKKHKSAFIYTSINPVAQPIKWVK